MSGSENLEIIFNNSASTSHLSNPQVILLWDKAVNYYAVNRIKAALDNFDQIIRIEPSTYGVHYAKAVCLAKAGHFKAALNSLKEELVQGEPYDLSEKFLSDIKERLKQDFSIGQLIGSEKDITIFTVPKPFRGHINIIQRNAIKSWTLLLPRPEIILLGDDEGVADAAKEFGIKHISHIKRNEFGTPLVNSIFETARLNSKNEIMVYINADIILTSDFIKAIQYADRQFLKFLMVGQRWDLDVTEMIDFSNQEWEDQISRSAEEHGRLHPPTGIDYYIFKGTIWPQIPSFALGRTVWDRWLLGQAHLNGTEVINATDVITAIHQNHDYGHLKGGKNEAWEGIEAKRNQAIAFEYGSYINIFETKWILNSNRLVNNPLEGIRIGPFLKEKLPRPILIWGAGSGGSKMLYFLNSLDITVNGFIDNNPEIVGTDLKGITIYSKDILYQTGGNLRPYIIIGTINLEEVEEYLLANDFKDDEDFLPGRLSKKILISMSELDC